MLLAAIALINTPNATPRFDLLCALEPSERRMSVDCVIDVPSRYVVDGKLKLMLGDQMTAPEIWLGPGEGQKAAIEKGAVVDHVASYMLRVPSGPARLRVKYASQSSSGFVYLLSSTECLAGGYNTLWFPAFDDARRAIGSLKFEAPKNFVVKASGKAVEVLANGDRTTSTFSMTQPMTPTFAAAPFAITKIPGKTPITLYFLKRRANESDFAKGCAQAIQTLEACFGKYPYPDFSIIETPNGLGFSGASFEGFMFGDASSIDNGFQPAYFGHEIGHQWWGNLVGMTGGKGEYAFSEGLAQYGSLQFVRTQMGVNLAKRYRTIGYPLYSDRQCLRGALAMWATGAETPLSAAPAERSALQHQMANSKGFLVWETLARTIGRDRFQSALQRIAKNHAFGALTWDEFWTELATNTGRNLDEFRAQWFERAGHPTLWTTWTQSGAHLSIDMRQTAPTFHLRAPLVIAFKNGRKQLIEVDLSAESQTLKLAASSEVESVELDPDFETFHSTPTLDAEAIALKEFSQIDLVEALTTEAPDAEGRLRRAIDAVAHPDVFGAEFLLRYSLSSALRDAGKLDEAYAEALRAIECPIRNPEMLPYAYLRLASLSRSKGRDADVAKWLHAMRAAESTLDYPSGAIEQARRRFPELAY